uniref:Disease resistance protein n=1 Tax=Brassica rapa subsp. pekinensis TaxID=51351 RepID=D1GEI8_BRARP|nr:disease resistance protein [Brassica rapa subsp. pekinensis]
MNRMLTFLFSKGYIEKLEENLNYLVKEMKFLMAVKDEVLIKVGREQWLHQQRRPTVQEWLTRVDDAYARFKILVKKLRLEGYFKEVTELPPRPEVVKRPTWGTVGQEEMLETASNRLIDDNVGIMGLHGMGGVGKTTLFKKIHNKFTEISGKFHIVIWIFVSQGANITKVQEDIAQKLHLCGDEWTKKNESDKAAEMQEDVCKEDGCKVAFTTRSEDVCKRMGDHDPMQVKCLKEDQAWELFKLKVGDEQLRREPRIDVLARKVAEKCHGLPLALSVIGETMASKTTVQEWEDAVYVLNRDAAEFSDMENDILPVLKYSYDNLLDDKVRLCFLYCALFPEDGQIDKEGLIEYWICEGFMGEYQVLKRAINKGYGVVSTLIRANLLTAVDTKTVMMHDVVREMALWIASDLGENKENFVVQARVGLHQVPKVKDWKAVKRISLMGNKIEEMTCSSKCSELTTLLLQSNKLEILSGKIIQYMKKLVVLDLSSNINMSGLPGRISELTSLQYLDLSDTRVEQLPVGFQELKKLTHLNLASTSRLCSISGISKLSSSRILKLFGSNVQGDVNLVKELQLLEHLQVLTIDVSTELGLKQILGDQRLVNCIYRLHIHDFQEKPFDLSLLVSMENLRELRVTSMHVSYTKCSGSEIDSSDLHNPTRPCFTNLSNKATKLTSISPFEKLEELYLDKLPRLESIYWSHLPFPFLRLTEIRNCPKLRKLPLNATSVSRVEKLSISAPMSNFEWEDEDTLNRFLPSILKSLALNLHYPGLGLLTV